MTEDADLGLRLAMQGYRCGIIQSTTQEEANCHLPNWVRQRSRWIKGWLQTYLVRMRHPVRLLHTLGLRGFIGFQIVIGGFTLSNLIHPVFYLAALGLIFGGHAPAGYAQGKGLLGFYIFVLCSGYSLSIAAGLVAAAARGRPQLFLSAFMMPFYWILISIAGYKAIWQLFTRPFHWEKTEHGLSRMMPSFLPPPAPPPSH